MNSRVKSKVVDMKKYINTVLRGVILLQALVLTSCNVLHDDLSDCNLFLKFRYDYNLTYEDWFGQQVEEVKVFIFDKQGRFVDMYSQTALTISSPGYKMQIPYQYKDYNVIVWAGKTDRDYILSPLGIGDPMENLALHYTPENNLSSHHIAPLWHSGPHKMIFPDAGGVEQTISLVRNTNDFNISIVSANTVKSVADYEITIKGANGSYDHKNDFPKGIPAITYTSTGNAQLQAADIYTMRLVEGAALRISAKEKASGKYILIEGKTDADLIELLLKTKPEQMPLQEYLDRRYIWDISLGYDEGSHMAIYITINGWTHWFHNTDL